MDKSSVHAIVKQFREDVITITHSTGKPIESDDINELVNAICKMVIRLMDSDS